MNAWLQRLFVLIGMFTIFIILFTLLQLSNDQRTLIQIKSKNIESQNAFWSYDDYNSENRNFTKQQKHDKKSQSNVLKQQENGYIAGSLEHFDELLYHRALNAVEEIHVQDKPGKAGNQIKSRIRKPLTPKHKPPDPKPHSQFLNICQGFQAAETTTVLFTSMYHDETKQYLFNNTLTNYALLGKEILPILFITDYQIILKSGYLIYRACQIGWTVAAAPERTPFGYPIINKMFSYAKQLYKVRWYGYSNADILFTQNLTHLLNYLTHSKDPGLDKFYFLTSKRTNVYIKAGRNLESLRDVEELKQAANGSLHGAMAIDYFIYRNDSLIFQDMPAFCTGRRGFDNWLVYHAVAHGIPSIDMTNYVTGVHLGIAGISFKNNSHRSRREENDYNMKIAKGYSWVNKGSINCMSHFIKLKSQETQNKTNNEINMIQKQKVSFGIYERTKMSIRCRTRKRPLFNKPIPIRRKTLL